MACRRRRSRPQHAAAAATRAALAASLALLCSPEWAAGVQLVDTRLQQWSANATAHPWQRPLPSGAGWCEGADGGSRCDGPAVAQLMQAVGVQAGLLQQPAVYAQDYSYLEAAIDEAPWRLRGILLFDPSRGAQDGVAWMEDMAASRRWVGVRFDPELFNSSGVDMAGEAGQAIFDHAARLTLTVVYGCAGGLAAHAAGISSLLEKSPETLVVLESTGCFLRSGLSAPDEGSWQSLLTFAKHTQVYVQVTDLGSRAERSRRLGKLLRAFGASRLMWGSDFPFRHRTDVSYSGALDAVRASSAWSDAPADGREAFTAGTANRVFGRAHHEDHYKALIASAVAFVLLSAVVAMCAMYVVTPVQTDAAAPHEEGTEMSSRSYTSHGAATFGGKSYVASDVRSYMTASARSYAH